MIDFSGGGCCGLSVSGGRVIGVSFVLWDALTGCVGLYRWSNVFCL